MNRLLLLTLGALTLPAAAQVSTTSIYSEPAGASFYVDGQIYTSAASFLWPQGSKHTLAIDPLQPDPSVKKRYAFSGWIDSTGLLTGAASVLIVTADPSITYYKAAVTLQFAVSLSYFNCSSTDLSACRSPGTIFVNNSAFLANTDVYLAAGSSVVLRAIPSPGYVFAGWLPGAPVPIQPYLNTFV